MRHFKSFVTFALQVILLTLCLFLFAALSLDALEWETTGKCDGCLILPEMSSRFHNPS
jgi:hypothetical protein